MAIQFDVCGVGNALVDVIAPATDAFLVEHAITKGAMTLIFDEAAVETLYAKLPLLVDARRTSGKSAMINWAAFSVMISMQVAYPMILSPVQGVRQLADA